MSENAAELPVLHVLVVGFHHIKGYQVEYSYPPLEGGVGDDGLPEAWRHLPSLALPDGAHNYDEDSVFFHLPALDDHNKTIYGVSCYRQINAERLLNRESDVTRSSVQKSVCVLCRLPLYGLIRAKLELVTAAYFEERDFSQVALLRETYESLNASSGCLQTNSEMLRDTQLFLGLSVRSFILRYRHKALVLFKLMLLEKRVLVFQTPVKDLCATVLTLCSLFPGMLEHGLGGSASALARSGIHSAGETSPDDDVMDGIKNSTSKSRFYQAEMTMSSLEKALESESNDLNVCAPKSSNESVCVSSGVERRKEERKSSSTWFDTSCDGDNDSIVESGEMSLLSQTMAAARQSVSDRTQVDETMDETNEPQSGSWGRDLLSRFLPVVGTAPKAVVPQASPNSDIAELLDSKEELKSRLELVSGEESNGSSVSQTPVGVGSAPIWSRLPSLITGQPEITNATGDAPQNAPNNNSNDMGDDQVMDEKMMQQLRKILDLSPSECGFPLDIFPTDRSLCLPYVSLGLLETLFEVGSCLVGATNDLFKQKRHLFDVIVEGDTITLLDPNLKRLLHLTTEDLRFADYLLKTVQQDNQDLFLDGTLHYAWRVLDDALHLGATRWHGGEDWLRAQFQAYLVSLMRTASADKSTSQPGIEGPFNTHFVEAWRKTHNYRKWAKNIPPVIDSFIPGSIERSDRLNKAVLTTGKAVGGALITAKSAVNSLWSHWQSATTGNSQSGAEGGDKNDQSDEGIQSPLDADDCEPQHDQSAHSITS